MLKGIESTCAYRFSDYHPSALKCDETSEPKNLKCPVYNEDNDKVRYTGKTSFPDWCHGRRFEDENRVTLDSALLRVLSFNAKEPKTMNKKVYYQLYEEYQKTGYSEKPKFLDFVEMQLNQFNTTASRILNDACKIFKGSSKGENHKAGEQIGQFKYGGTGDANPLLFPEQQDPTWKRVLEGFLSAFGGYQHYGSGGFHYP